MIPTITDTDLAAARIFNRIFTVEHRPDGSFLLKSRRTGKVVGAGFVSPRRYEKGVEFGSEASLRPAPDPTNADA